MFKYTLTPASDDLKILTPFVTDFNDVKKEITQTSDCIINVSHYPCGFTIKITQYANKIEIESNKELIDNGDSTYSVKL